MNLAETRVFIIQYVRFPHSELLPMGLDPGGLRRTVLLSNDRMTLCCV